MKPFGFAKTAFGMNGRNNAGSQLHFGCPCLAMSNRLHMQLALAVSLPCDDFFDRRRISQAKRRLGGKNAR
jgi:hypothetical protein